jgi:hypothetical protein
MAARDEMEKRIARLEARVQFMEDRRKALIPPELENDPNVKLVLRDSLDGFTAKLKAFAAQKGLDEAQTRFTAAKAEAAQKLERIAKEGEQKELAELVAAIEYYERTGQSPPGYDFSVEVQEVQD